MTRASIVSRSICPLKRATSKREAGRGRGGTSAFVDVNAGCPIAGEARVARAGEGAGSVGARCVGAAVVGPVWRTWGQLFRLPHPNLVF